MFRLLLLLKFIIVKESYINIIIHIISGSSVSENLVKIWIVSNHHGFYERLISILKDLQKKWNVGSPELNFEKLHTVLTQCKNIMNTTIVTNTLIIISII